MIPINLTTVSSVLISILGLIIYSIFSVPRGLRGLPRIPLIQTLKDLFQDKPFDRATIEINRALMEKHHIATIFTGGRWQVTVSSMEAAEKIYKSTKLFPKALLADMFPTGLITKFLGTNVIFSDGDGWKRHRQVVNPTFKKGFEPSIFGDLTRNLFTALNKFGETDVEVHPLIQKLSIDALGKAVMGLDFESVLNPDVPFINNYNLIMSSFSTLTYIFPILETPNNPMRKPAFEAVAYLEKHFDDILKERRSQLDATDNKKENLDLLTSMLLANEDGFTDKEIRDNVMMFLVAGQDTTALSICAALYFLAIHPEQQDRLFNEINDIVGCDSADPIVPTQQQFKEMPFLDAFIKETMRLYPAVARLPSRVCAEDVELEGHVIPRGTSVLIETFLIQRDPKYWKDPDTFDPTRFIDTKHNATVWSPFGGGSRLCLGMSFSLLEQKVVLAMLLQKYRMTSKSDQFPLLSSFLLSPDNLRLNFETRV